MANKSLLLFTIFIFSAWLVHAQTGTYIVRYSQGDVTAIVNGQTIPIMAKLKLDNYQYLKIGSHSMAILINQDGIPKKFEKENTYRIQDLGKYFKTDPLTTKYFKFIWEEMELKPHDRHSLNLNVVAATVRGEEGKEFPRMVCPFDSTVITSDSVLFSWTDPLKKGKFFLFVYDYQNTWEIPILKKEVSSNFFYLNARDLGLQPGKDYAWIVSYTDSVSKQRFCNIISIPGDNWLKNYKDKLHDQVEIVTDEYDQLRYAFFLLENRQFCNARSTYQKAATLNEKDEIIRKAKMFFEY